MEEKQIIQILTGEFHATLQHISNTLIKREHTFPHVPDKIKVVIGMRRTGKT